MTTVRQIEKLWNSQAYSSLSRAMLAGRIEGAVNSVSELAGPIPTAAIALVRLSELGQSHVPLYSKLLRTILAHQDADGGWGDPITTALCLRALMAGNGAGVAIDRGLDYLAEMQKSEGLWPKVPFRRMPADPFVSAFILLQLGSNPHFRENVRLTDAANWFESNGDILDEQTRQLWNFAAIRCHQFVCPTMQTAFAWS